MALDGIITLAIGAVFFFGYMYDRHNAMLNQEQKEHRELEARYIWLALSIGLFISSFFLVSNVSTTVTLTRSAYLNGTVNATTTYNYTPDIPLQKIGEAFGIVICIFIILIQIVKAAGVITGFRW